MLDNPAKVDRSKITFDSQSTFILDVHGKEDAYIYMGDRWEPENPMTATYVWLPIEFNENGRPYIRWHEEWDLSFFDE